MIVFIRDAIYFDEWYVLGPYSPTYAVGEQENRFISLLLAPVN